MATDPRHRSRNEENSTPPGPRELSRLEVLQGLRISTWEASYSTIHATLTGGAFLTGFALWLGANSLAIGLLTAIPTFAGFVQIVASYISERRTERRKFTAWFSTVGRALWFLVLLLPLVLPRTAALYPFLILYTLSFVLLNIPAPAWMSWMSDLVPPSHRGRYFAQRNMIAGIVGMVIGLPAAWFLDNTTRHSHQAFGFGTLFGLAVLASFASFALLLRQPEPPKREIADANRPASLSAILAYYRAPFADRNFRNLLTFNAILSAGQFFAAPFFTVYALEKLHMNYTWLQILGTISSIASLGSMPLWGMLADKVGNRSLLAIGAVGVLTLPITWALTTPNHPFLMMILLVEINLAGGLFWAGVGLTQFNLLINSSPTDKTSVYVATMAAVTGLAGGVSPLIGGTVMHSLHGWHHHLFGLEMTNFHVTFLISAALRLVALFFLGSISDVHSTSPLEVLHQLSRARPQSWRHMRSLQGGTEEARIRATEALGETKTQLAVGELQTALTDPSAEVRTEAARALGVIGDCTAVGALLVALDDPVPEVVEEAVRALGHIRDTEATPALIQLLQDDHGVYSQRVRLATARALGALGGPEATDALLKTLKRAKDEELRVSIVRSLGEIGDMRAAPELISILENDTPPNSLRLALIRSLGEIGEPSAVQVLRHILAQTDTSTVFLPPLADALARLRDTKSVLPLLDALDRLDSEVARKQVAYSIGILLDTGPEVYQLLSREEFARDAAVSKMIGDMQKSVRSNIAMEPLFRVILDSYTRSNFTGCLRAIERVSRNLPHNEEQDDGLHYSAVLKHLVERSRDNLPIESILLGFATLYKQIERTTKG